LSFQPKGPKRGITKQKMTRKIERKQDYGARGGDLAYRNSKKASKKQYLHRYDLAHVLIPHLGGDDKNNVRMQSCARIKEKSFHINVYFPLNEGP
jgi:hypothetical protein